MMSFLNRREFLGGLAAAGVATRVGFAQQQASATLTIGQPAAKTVPEDFIGLS